MRGRCVGPGHIEARAGGGSCRRYLTRQPFADPAAKSRGMTGRKPNGRVRIPAAVLGGAYTRTAPHRRHPWTPSTDRLGPAQPSMKLPSVVYPAPRRGSRPLPVKKRAHEGEIRFPPLWGNKEPFPKDNTADYRGFLKPRGLLMDPGVLASPTHKLVKGINPLRFTFLPETLPFLLRP